MKFLAGPATAFSRSVGRHPIARRFLQAAALVFSVGILGAQATWAGAPSGLYVALGDSITAGTGTTVPCKPLPLVPMDIDSFCPQGTSYPLLVARGLKSDGRANRVLNLGIPGATADRVLQDEIPHLPSDASIITLYIGTNDSRQFGKTDSTVAQVVAHFTEVYQKILDAIAQRAPKALVIVVNVPNEEVIGRSYPIDDQHRTRFGQVSHAFDLWINALYPRYRVVDTVCSAASYDTSHRYKQSVHLNDDGAKDLAALILNVVRADRPIAPATSCEWFTP